MLAFIQVSANGTWCIVTTTTKHLQSKWMPYVDQLYLILVLYFVTYVWVGSDCNTDQTNTSHNTCKSYTITHTQTILINGHFLGKPELAGRPPWFLLSNHLYPQNPHRTGFQKSSYHLDSIPPGFSWASFLFSSPVNLHRHPYITWPHTLLGYLTCIVVPHVHMDSMFGPKSANFNELHNVNVYCTALCLLDIHNL